MDMLGAKKSPKTTRSWETFYLYKNKLNQKHIRNGAKQNAEQRVPPPKIGHGYDQTAHKRRNPSLKGRHVGPLQAKDNQHSHDGGRKKPSQLFHDGWNLSSLTKDQKGQETKHRRNQSDHSYQETCAFITHDGPPQDRSKAEERSKASLGSENAPHRRSKDTESIYPRQ